MYSNLKRKIGGLLILTMLMSLFCVSPFSADSYNVIDSITGDATWSFLSADAKFLPSILEESDEFDRLYAARTAENKNITYTVYAIGGKDGLSYYDYTFGDMTFTGTSAAAVKFWSFPGYGRVNLDPGASVSFPVNGQCSLKFNMYVDTKDGSGNTDAGDGEVTIYADDTVVAKETPVDKSAGTATSYTYTYGEKTPASIILKNTGNDIIAVSGVSVKHIVQGSLDLKDCSEPDDFIFSKNVYVVGDETISSYAFNSYFSDSVNVKNYAASGNTSKSFSESEKYTEMFDSVGAGDYIFIQYGHNDEIVSGSAFAVTPVSKIGTESADWVRSKDGLISDENGNNIPCFEWFLYYKYIKPAREKGAQPVLITPITKRAEDGAASSDTVHSDYAGAVRQLAADYNVPMIDLYYDSVNYWNKVFAESGAEGTAALHAQKDGLTDNINLSKEGALYAAKVIAVSIKRFGLKLADETNVEIEKVKEITVDANALQTNVNTLTFKTVSDALRYIEKNNVPSSEEERVTLNFKAGTYREQIFVNTPYLTFKNADSTDYNDVILTWYYGIGYKYYSIGQDGVYDKTAAKENKENGTYTAPCTNWGHTIRINQGATAFKAENITFESSFNRYVTQEEIDDGVTPVTVVVETINGKKTVTNEEGKLFYKDGTNGSKPARAKLGAGSTAVQGKDYRERSCAFFILADKAEMNHCYFVSEQDTLGTNYMRQYYKDCVIEGTVDYICGTGNSIFDNCELRWGTTANSSGGYVCAPKGNYLFYNCTVTGNGNDKTNSWARPWGGQNSNATMFKSVITKNNNGKLNILGTGYSNMSDNSAAEAKFYEYGSVDQSGNAIDLSGRLKNTVQPFGTAVTDKWLMLEFNPYNYTTGKYGIDNTSNVKFNVDDWDPMNRAERMAPILNALNFDLSEYNKNVSYDETSKAYDVKTSAIKLPELPDGLERKIVSASANVNVSDDGGTLKFVNPAKGAPSVSAELTVYIREKDSDEWGDLRTISLSISPIDYKKGDFDGNGIIEVNDAVSALQYILNPSDDSLYYISDENIEAGKILGGEELTARDVSLILKEALTSSE